MCVFPKINDLIKPALAIRSDCGGFWMKPAPAVVTLIQGLALSTFGWVLTTNGSPETGDLENVLPIYTWAVTGALLAIYSVVSLFMTND